MRSTISLPALLALVFALLLGALSCAPAAAEGAKLRWGVDLEGGAPYAFRDPRNPDSVIGFEQEIADEIGRRLAKPVQLVQINWDSLIPALGRGTVDFAMSGIEITDEHKLGALFSRPYYVYREQVVVRRDDNRVQVFADLKGKRVGTLTATAAHHMLEKLGGVDIKHYSDMFAIYQDLAIGRLDAVFLDKPIAVHYARGNDKLRFVPSAIGEGYYGIALRKENEALKRDLDRVIADMLGDGSLEAILARWGLWNEDQAKLAAYHDAQPVKAEAGPAWQRFLPVLLQGALMTVQISVLAMGLAMAIGMFVSIARIYGPPPLQWLATAYVEVFRGTPLLIQLYLIYYGLPNLPGGGIQIDAFVAGVVGLGMNYGAAEAENWRAGIQAVPRGQTEASLALGMSRYQVLRHVILPQSLRVAIPPVTNDFIALFKDSSLVSVITLVELTKTYGMLASATYDYIGLGLLTALIYLAISYPTSLFARWTESRLRKA
ncbi:MAG: ABC transporter permease subunit [Candidatus Sericytochromatia bacterium]|nr:ABC transporter permease subunit [Candidatus Tanganyikabacteria bacterium]